MTKVNRNYEIYIIVDGNFEDPNVEEVITKYENFMKKNGAEIKNIDRIGRRRLAYQIKKRVNGYYVCYEISAPSDLVSKLEKSFRIDETILRNLAIQMSKQEIAEKQEYLIKKASILANLEAENKAKQDLLNESLETPEIAEEEISNENDVKQD